MLRSHLTINSTRYEQSLVIQKSKPVGQARTVLISLAYRLRDTPDRHKTPLLFLGGTIPFSYHVFFFLFHVDIVIAQVNLCYCMSKSCLTAANQLRLLSDIN